METGRGLVGLEIDRVIDLEMVIAQVSGTDLEAEIGQVFGIVLGLEIGPGSGTGRISAGRQIGTSTGRLFDRIGRTAIGIMDTGGAGAIDGTALGIVVDGR